MKKIMLLLAVSLMGLTTTYAQKFAYVDMEYILGKLPQYAEAQKQLDKVADAWQKDIEGRMKTVDDM
jgi:outer membrane protein